MILVDTSVWVDYFRGADRRLLEELQGLLDGDRVALATPVRIELLAGSPKRQLPWLRRALSGLPTFTPQQSTWELVEQWVESAVSKGERFGAMDLVIAATAAEQGMTLWSLDSDFSRMERLGFVRLYLRPPRK